MANEITRVGNQTIEGTTALQQRVMAVHDAYASVMVNGTHYGTIPGCGNKPTLLKPGAEMLCTQFRLVPTYNIDRTDLEDGHREYGVTCTLTKLDTGEVWAQGVGLCTTLESKYRYRGKGENRRDNPDIADTYNTVLKMAKKRALVDATLTATGCSDMFTQDIEDFRDVAVQPVVVEEVAMATREQLERLDKAASKLAELRSMDKQAVADALLKSKAVRATGYVEGELTEAAARAALVMADKWIGQAMASTEQPQAEEVAEPEPEHEEAAEPEAEYYADDVEF